MLTNWKTISNSIKRYKKLTIDLKKENTGFTKKKRKFKNGNSKR